MKVPPAAWASKSSTNKLYHKDHLRCCPCERSLTYTISTPRFTFSGRLASEPSSPVYDG
ncbi:LIM domain-containing protein [Sporomusa rhizae]|uniref:LIM domain-containing protein n=1 Tax=Sporomusa rhizae TaxID=357999 RepID=UPI00352B0CF8